MHLTRIKMKNGDKFSGFVMLWRPELGWMELQSGGKRKRVSFDDIESAVTENERISINKIADQDELKRAREYLAQGRQYKWPSMPKKKFKWEDAP